MLSRLVITFLPRSKCLLISFTKVKKILKTSVNHLKAKKLI